MASKLRAITGISVVIAVSYHDTVTKLQELAVSAQGPFDRAEWFSLLSAHDRPPVVVTAEEGGAQAAMVLAQGNDGWESLRNWFSFIWRPHIPDGSQGDRLLRAMARDLRKSTHHLLFQPVPDEDGSASRLANAMRKNGWVVEKTAIDENHILTVNGRSFEEYWSTRPGKMRTTLQRKAKKVSTEISTQFDSALWSEYQAIYAESWKPVEERADLLEAFAKAEGEAGRLRLGIARSDGRAVAAQFWTVENGTAYIHKLAHTEAAKPLSAGTTLSAALFAHVIDKDRVHLIDFGTGTDAYKRDWMESIRPRYRLLCLDPRQPRAWPVLAKLLVRRLATRISRG